MRIAGLLLQEPNRFRGNNGILSLLSYIYRGEDDFGANKGDCSLARTEQNPPAMQATIARIRFCKMNQSPIQCRTDKSLSEAFLGKMIIPKVRTASSSYCLLATCAEDPAIRPTSFLPCLSFLGPTRVYCSLRYAIPLTVLTSRSKMYFGFMTGP